MEREIELKHLVVCGGKPAFGESLHVNKPNLGNSALFHRYVDEILASGTYTNDGPFVRRLEQRIGEFLQVEHCILANSGTNALILLLIALELTGNVIVPAFTFISTAHVLTLLGIQPIFCDIVSETHNLDPEQCKSLITPETSAIIGTHVWGRACDVGALQDLVEEHEIALIFDAAHAFGCSHQGRMIGGFGDAEVLSLHATKAFHTFEGGAITTNDTRLADRLRSARNFGFVGYDEVAGLGINGKMPEISAAAGLVNLDDLTRVTDASRRTYENYARGLSGINGISLIEYDKLERQNYHFIVTEIDDAKTGITRDQLVKVLHLEHVLARRYFYPGAHRMKPHETTCGQPTLARTDRLCERVLVLPGGSRLTEKDVSRICQLLRVVVENAETVLQCVKDQTSLEGAAIRVPDAP